MTIRWLSESDDPGIVTAVTPSGDQIWNLKPVPANPLAYNPFKEEPEAPHPGLPWLHSTQLD